MTGLQPSKTYYYRVGSPAEWSPVYSFSTKREYPSTFILFYPLLSLPPSLSILSVFFILIENSFIKVRVIITGDVGSTDNSWKTINGMMTVHKKNPVDFVMHSGDISYANGIQPYWDAWQNHVQPLTSTVPYMVTVGWWISTYIFPHSRKSRDDVSLGCIPLPLCHACQREWRSGRFSFSFCEFLAIHCRQEICFILLIMVRCILLDWVLRCSLLSFSSFWISRMSYLSISFLSINFSSKIWRNWIDPRRRGFLLHGIGSTSTCVLLILWEDQCIAALLLTTIRIKRCEFPSSPFCSKTKWIFLLLVPLFLVQLFALMHRPRSCLWTYQTHF